MHRGHHVVRSVLLQEGHRLSERPHWEVRLPGGHHAMWGRVLQGRSGVLEHGHEYVQGRRRHVLGGQSGVREQLLPQWADL
jgi:hypothetical protein